MRAARSLAPPTARPGVRGVILVVDDMTDAREMLAALLEVEGFQAVTASSGVEALAALKEIEVDVLVSDLEMRGMSGAQLAACLANHPRHRKIPVVLVTSCDEDRTAALLQAASAVVAEVLAKPLDPDEVVRVIGRTMDGLGGKVSLAAG